MSKFKCGLILIMLISIWGCSKGNDNSVNLDASGKHPAGWAVALVGGNHPAMYMTGQEKCQECHGADLKGGTSNVSCFSADRNGITCHAQGPSGHPPGWSDPAAHGAHAKAAAVGANGLAFCANCHGSDYRGAGATQKDCLRCHTTAPHPPKPWFGGTYTHKSTDTSNAPACATCHTNKAHLSVTGLAALPATAIIGTTGCFNNTLCHGVMGHSSDPQPWSSRANHGIRAKSDPSTGGNTGFATCQQCHGNDFSGGSVNQSCFPCHTVSAPHPKRADWTLKAGTLSHVTTGEGNAVICSNCHNAGTKNLSEPYLTRFASSPAGSFNGASPVTCFNAGLCHGDVRKTVNCDACHSIATSNPFKSMAGATATTDSKVGAHVKHLNASVQVPSYSANIPCSECHTVPSSPASSGLSGTHRNGTTVMTFGTLAKTGSLVPNYTAATGVCANTYCHGNTLDKPASAILSPNWNSPFLTGVASSDCVKCHGYPPATTTHTGKTPTMCSGCHPHVNSTGTGFVDISKHINGTIDASGGAPHSVPLGAAGYPGASHKSTSNISVCVTCHGTPTIGSSYSLNGSTAPNCCGCHLNAAPSTDPHCSDCHGDALTGRPSGNTFPNRQGHHNTGEMRVACITCHPFTTGDTRHGWSAGKKSTSAQLNASIGWNSTTRTCNNSCHGSNLGSW